jgi:hypothetical protein
MTVSRNKKGQLAKGSTLNPAGRPRNAYARLLAEMKQVSFCEWYYGLLDKTPEDLKAISEDPKTTAMQRVALKFLVDAMKGDADIKVFLALLGINVSGNTNILLNTAAFDDPDKPTGEMKDVTPAENITHIKVVEIIESINQKAAKKKKNE